jgi:DMSO reductase anchor subunit
LSREVIALPAFMAVVFMYGVAQLAGYRPDVVTLPSGLVVDLTVVLGITGTLLSFALFVCTGMIYACLRFLREWNTPLTVINFILMGGSSGFILAAFYSAWAAPSETGFFAGWAIIITLLAFAGRVASLVRNARIKPKSTIQTAIGIKHPRITQRSMGAMGGSFNTREFFHGKSVSFMRAVKPTFLVLAFVVPLALLALGIHSAVLLGIAFILQYLGLLAERWFFFAQANHPQNLYYQTIG